MMMMNESSSRYPFTASQWQELEHQALIYKYMVSGIPIPSDLILPIRRSAFLLDSTKTSPSLAFPPQTQLGWNCFHAGYGRKAEDPEPGRCRRTDGKKWRCSKEAYTDSKYCERHMHRGKNRSRKPVEISLAASNNTSSSSSPIESPHPANISISTTDTYKLLHPYSNTSRPPGSHFSNFPCSFSLQLDSAPYSLDRDYRYGEEMKNLEGYSFSSCGSGVERENPLQLKPLGMSSSMTENKQSSLNLSKEEEEERQKPALRHFFDEWPQKSKESWMDLEGGNTSYNKTQLSMSFPKWF